MSDTAEANRRAEWLHKHKAPKDWIVLTTSEVSTIREELAAVERERDKAIEKHRLAVINWQRDVFKMQRERDEAREKLEDWENSAKNVRSEWPDEQHCSCVPILRKLLKDAERERDEAREAIRQFYKAKGRFNSQIACAKMFEIVGLPADYPVNYQKKEGGK